MPYLPMDPADVGRSYEAIIRVNSQSGKGGVAYVLERHHGLRLPRRFQVEFSAAIKTISAASGNELTAADIWAAFRDEYLDRTEPLCLIDYEIRRAAGDKNQRQLRARLRRNGGEIHTMATGSGPVDAFVNALRALTGDRLEILSYEEHALGMEVLKTVPAVSVFPPSLAVAYVELSVNAAAESVRGVGVHADIVTATLTAIVCAMNRVVGSRA